MMRAKSAKRKSNANARHKQSLDLVCPECGESAVVTVPTRHRFRYAGEKPAMIDVTLPVRHCQECGFDFLDHEAEQVQHEAVCKHLGLLTPRQIRELRIDLGLSRVELARLTGFGEATIARWERGSLIQNAANDRYLKLLAHRDNVKRLEKLAVGAK